MVALLDGWLFKTGLVAIAGEYQRPYFAMHIASTTTQCKYLMPTTSPVQSTPELLEHFLILLQIIIAICTCLRNNFQDYAYIYIFENVKS